MTERSPETDKAVEHLLALVAGRYGERLTEAELTAVRQNVAAIAEMARALRAVKLDPRDEPMPPFAPFRGES